MGMEGGHRPREKNEVRGVKGDQMSKDRNGRGVRDSPAVPIEELNHWMEWEVGDQRFS